MPGDRRLPSWLPWALCWLSLGLQITGTGLRIGLPETDDEVFQALGAVLGAVLMSIVGGLIAARLPANRYGWLLCALGFHFGLVILSDGLRRTGLVAPWITWLVFGAGFALILFLLVLLLLLFPTGRLPGPAWRWLPRVALVAAALAVLVLPFTPSSEYGAAPTPWVAGGRAGEVLGLLLDGSFRVLFVLVLPAAVSVLVRYRRAGPVERQQLKWFLFSTALAAVALLVDQVGVLVGSRLWAVVDAASFALLPVAVGIAVLRYRLYEIDRIVSRTVTYGLLTAALVGVYVVAIVLLGPLLQTLTGGSSLAVAGSTLAVAAAFNPVRRRLQAVVDRRFDRARYDAARAVDAFTRRLRNQVDLEEVTSGLRETVGATVAPTRVGLWLRDVSPAREA